MGAGLFGCRGRVGGVRGGLGRWRGSAEAPRQERRLPLLAAVIAVAVRGPRRAWAGRLDLDRVGRQAEVLRAGLRGCGVLRAGAVRVSIVRARILPARIPLTWVRTARVPLSRIRLNRLRAARIPLARLLLVGRVERPASRGTRRPAGAIAPGSAARGRVCRAAGCASHGAPIGRACQPVPDGVASHAAAGGRACSAGRASRRLFRAAGASRGDPAGGAVAAAAPGAAARPGATRRAAHPTPRRRAAHPTRSQPVPARHPGPRRCRARPARNRRPCAPAAG